MLDPLAPPPAAREVWDRIEASPPCVVAVLKPDHLMETPLYLPEQRALVSPTG